ncbi:MAG: hypothetical protein ABJB12_01450 [Pseudomonadota bacterium]
MMTRAQRANVIDRWLVVKRSFRRGSACALALFALFPVAVEAQSSLAPHVFALSNDGFTWLDAERDHLAFSRELPAFVQPGQVAPHETEAVRLIFSGIARPPTALRVSSRRANGLPLDALAEPPLSQWPCPPSVSGSCWATLPLRLTPDRLDRNYFAAKGRSLEAELGGQVQVEAAGQTLATWRVGAPHSPFFAGAERFAVKLRVRVLRVSTAGAPAVGADAASAIALARAEVQAASKLWAQCGIDLQGPRGADIQVVDPPTISLVSVGCEQGLPASGGRLALSVQGHRVRVVTRPGDAPGIIASRLGRAIRGLGLTARVSPNPRGIADASGAVDVLIRNAAGTTVGVNVEADPNLPLSTDATLPLCLGEVDLANGLTHFVESDAAAGTVEERALIKAFDDGDPSTIEVLIVPSFDQSGRIGESFIDDDGSGIQNTVIVDRAALRAGPRSYALAHELGHILLEMPGHPDDYGVDQSGSLMDSDASDASVFGPRRLSLADCERALRESGPASRVPLLRAWPLLRANDQTRAPAPTSVR